MASPSPPAPQTDRAALLKAFDESRTGVRGLIESGASSVPELFVHPDPYASAPLAPPGVSIPVVDLSLPAPVAAAAAAEAARRWGFFHLVNYHGALAVSEDYPELALSAVRTFNELPAAERSAHYTRAMNSGVTYFSNVDLYNSSAASWRDTIQIALGTRRADPARIPAVCRNEILEWDAHTTAVGRAVLRLLSEGLGLTPAALEELSCLQGKAMVGHYYPVCPEPERTMGIVAHTDPGVLTVLAQDQIGGLQVKHTDEEGRSKWVDVKPVPGALVINVGDLLQV
jgi:isopenicillin N synthase-like dioxygenase